MRRLRTWLLTTPILVVGLFAGHELGYRLGLPNPDERAHELHETGHAYFAYAPYLAATLIAVGALALGLRMRDAFTEGRGGSHSLVFALLPPLGFVLLEIGERLRHGELALATFTAPEVLLGLLLQVPFALAALFVARVLAALADVVGVALRAGPPRAARAWIAGVLPALTDLPRVRVVALAYGERGPPPS